MTFLYICDCVICLRGTYDDSFAVAKEVDIAPYDIGSLSFLKYSVSQNVILEDF